MVGLGLVPLNGCHRLYVLRLAAWYHGLWITQTREYHLLEYMGQRRPCSGLGFLIKGMLLALYSALSNNWLGLGGMAWQSLTSHTRFWVGSQHGKQTNKWILKEESAFNDLTRTWWECQNSIMCRKKKPDSSPILPNNLQYKKKRHLLQASRSKTLSKFWFTSGVLTSNDLDYH